MVDIPESWVTTQNPLSFAWEIANAPAPIATQVNTFIVSLSSPKGPMIGAIIEAVVIMATVVEPCAVFSPNAIKKGKKIPQLPQLLLSKLPEQPIKLTPQSSQKMIATFCQIFWEG